MNTRIKYSIIGVPDHQAVIHVGGRIGAASGPAAFRKIFLGFNGMHPVIQIGKDLGDVRNLTQDVAANHHTAAKAIQKAHTEFGTSIVVGGSHDHGFSQLLGISKSLQGRKTRLGCLNIDAHLDVRKPNPWITSGSPFYLAIEQKILDPKRFIEFGIQSHCNAPELWDYVKRKKIHTIQYQKLRNQTAVPQFKKSLRTLADKCDQVVLSFDLDAAAAAFAPGVSAPQTEGFSSSELIEMMEIAGSEKKVTSLGIFELNPLHDIENLTARLAATAAYHFIESKFFR